jgi:hypothetical protein
MTKPLLPWKLRGSDFSKPGWHTRPTIGYELMFEYLRLSPSYELARKYQMEGLSNAEKAALPSDFDVVLRTYRMLGDVQTTLFRSWWIRRGLQVFGNPFARPKLHVVASLAGGADIAATALNTDIDNFLSGKRHEEGLVSSVLVSVPLNLKQTEIRKQMAAILSQYLAQPQGATAEPVLKLQGKRLRAKVLFNGLRLLWFKAAKPKWEHWRLGAKARFSETYSSALDPANERWVTSTLESYDREMMTKITGRALKKFETIAENAARGKFPSQDPVPLSNFQYPLLAKRIQRKNEWEKKEKARLLAIFQNKQARSSV